MSFISYAQNFEDVMLWRALKNVERGFYIDVGANDPSIDSVTKAFYERGWSGINIEPLPSHHADLLQARPRDVNLQCAVGATNGEIEVWECDVRGWATADESVVALHRANGHEGVFHKVPVLPLSEICAAYVKGDVHFLKIDVEGFEKSVIEGIDFFNFRPWILVIEATRPNSTEEVHDDWENIVLSCNYLLAYTDGLNRFYVAKEHSELLAALRYPPNVFDGFIRSEQLNSELRAQQAEAKAKAQQAETIAQQAKAEQAEAKAEQAEAKAEQAEAKAEQAEAKAEQAEAKVEQAEAKVEQAEAASNQALTQLHAVYASTSWRITASLRKLGHATGVFLQWPKVAKSALKTKIKLLLAHVKLYVIRRPKLQIAVMRVLAKFPNLKARLKQASLSSYSAQTTAPDIPTELVNLTPRARQIYADLKTAIEQSQKESR